MNFIKYIKQETEIIKKKDPAIRSNLEVLLYPSFWAIYYYRKAHKLYEKGHFYRARKISQRAARKTGIEIHPGAVIGEGFFIDHGHGVVIGETAIIGDNVTLYQGVTLGGTGKEHGKRHPTLGNNCKIGAGSVVVKNVPDDSTVVGIPGKVVVQDCKRMIENLDQVTLPDPVAAEFCKLKDENERILKRLAKLEKQVAENRDHMIIN